MEKVLKRTNRKSGILVRVSENELEKHGKENEK